MAREGDTGICVDLNYLVRLHRTLSTPLWSLAPCPPCSQYQQSCPIKPLSQAVGAIVGCADTWISAFLCGLTVDRVGPDGSGVSITSGLAYPRTLVTATPDLDGDYRNTPEMTCSDPLDCQNKYATMNSNPKPRPLAIWKDQRAKRALLLGDANASPGFPLASMDASSSNGRFWHAQLGSSDRTT